MQVALPCCAIPIGLHCRPCCNLRASQPVSRIGCISPGIRVPCGIAQAWNATVGCIPPRHGTLPTPMGRRPLFPVCSRFVLCSPFVPGLFPVPVLFTVCSAPSVHALFPFCSPSVPPLFRVPDPFTVCSLFVHGLFWFCSWFVHGLFSRYPNLDHHHTATGKGRPQFWFQNPPLQIPQKSTQTTLLFKSLQNQLKQPSPQILYAMFHVKHFVVMGPLLGTSPL